jgi:hypothetical protein
MKQVKLFEQFLAESADSQLSHAVLTALEPTIATMVDNIKKWIVEENAKKGIKYEINEWEAEMIRLGLIVDMLKSFEKYTEPTDKLVKISASGGRKGIEISATIERDGTEYPYYTEAIGAGGYNIQSFHYRYLTKTTLPSSKIKGTLANEYAEKMKKMNKAEKLNYEIKNYERDIEKIDAKLAELGTPSDEQIGKILKDEGHYSYNNPSWEQIIKNGAAKNYNNSEEEYNASVAQYQSNGIDFWRTQNIEWPTKRRKSLEKEIAKLKAKLEALI